MNIYIIVLVLAVHVSVTHYVEMWLKSYVVKYYIWKLEYNELCITFYESLRFFLDIMYNFRLVKSVIYSFN